MPREESKNENKTNHSYTLDNKGGNSLPPRSPERRKDRMGVLKKDTMPSKHQKCPFWLLPSHSSGVTLYDLVLYQSCFDCLPDAWKNMQAKIARRRPLRSACVVFFCSMSHSLSTRSFLLSSSKPPRGWRRRLLPPLWRQWWLRRLLVLESSVMVVWCL
jgi:hypothetical protein